MPAIVFPSSSAPGKDAIESAGRLVNAYAERLQEGAPAPFVIRRPPGLTAFSQTAEESFRGMWYDGSSYLYAAFDGTLVYIDSTGAETTVGALLGARISFLSSAGDGTNQTTYTFAGVSFGAAHPNRRIVVAVAFDLADDHPPASITIGGVSPTLIDSEARVYLYIAAVPTGTSGDIVVQCATAANRLHYAAWRLDGALSSTPHHKVGWTASAVMSTSANLNMPSGGTGVVAARTNIDEPGWTPFTTDYDEAVEGTYYANGASGASAVAATITLRAEGLISTWDAQAASWAGAPGDPDVVTFAKNNKSPTPDQVLCTPVIGAFTFTTSAISVLDVNGELPNSVCFGEGYFFFTTPGGLCYASGLNATTVSALDVTRAEQRAEALIRGVFFDGQLLLFGQSHTEVFASGGNPNLAGFPLNFVTSIWRGLIAPLAVTGFEEGFEGGLFFVADDNSVRMLQGYNPVTISTAPVERAIEACTDKSGIRAFCYDVDGHACVVIDLAGEATWVYDLTEGGNWHERDTADSGAWRATGNSVKAFGKWLVGDRLTGNIYQVDKDARNDGGLAMPWVPESIAMEAFPQRLQIARADFNFVSGVGSLSDAVGGNDQYTKVLIHMDGADASTTFTDVNAGGSAHVWTANGNAQVDTADFPFGTGALLCDGTGDYLSTPDHADFVLGTSDFTVDAWFKCTMAAGAGGRFIMYQTDFVAANYSFLVYLNGSSKIAGIVSDGSATTQVVGTTSFSDVLNTGWHHVAFVRTGNTLRLFIDGVQEGGDVTFTGTIPNSTSELRISGSSTVAWGGWLAEPRLSVGVARWTTNFTPQRSQYSGTVAAARDPKVLIQWSDDGGHRWSDPVSRKLGEAGRYLEHVRVNRLGLTGTKGRRFRLRVDDEVYVGLLAGSMEVGGRP